MSTRQWLALAIFAIGAVVSGVWAVVNLRPVTEMFGAGSGFAGGTVDTIDAFTFIVAPLVAFAISRRLRQRGVLARRLRRAHIILSVTIVALIASLIVSEVLGTFAHGLNGLGFALLVATVAGGALWLPVQSFFTAGFISLLIAKRETAS